MNLNNYKSLYLVALLLFLNTAICTAETQVSAEEESVEEEEPVEIDPTDPIRSGVAEHAYKRPNVCEGMEEGDYLGSEVCSECHEDKTQTMKSTSHGQAADARSPFGAHGCETCHGPGMLHFDVEGNCIISMTGRYGESVEQRNEVCLDCHQSGERMHWMSSAHEAEGLVCVNCHSIHKTNDVIDRSSEAEVCFNCHKKIRAQTFSASSHPIRDKQLVCSDCHNSHGSAAPSSLKQLTVNENCYSCHAEKRGPFLWEHYPASEDCTLCHRVHGSNHQALLQKPGPQLCQQCHSLESSGGGLNHIGNVLDFSTTNPGRE